MADAGADADARTVLGDEVRHWRGAAHALGDLEMVAAPAAWAALESYLERAIRSRLRGAAAAVAADADRLTSALAAAAGSADLAAVRTGLLRLRRDYLRAETVIEFFADAVN